LHNGFVPAVIERCLLSDRMQKRMTHSASLIPRVALVGYRCTGKTTVGRLLAHEWKLPFVDLDLEIRKVLGMDVARFVLDQGWEPFRDIETKLLARCGRETPCILATGGGVVESEISRRRLKECFFTVWLTASAATIRARMTSDPTSEHQRPSLTGISPEEEVEGLLARRAPWYEECAHAMVSTEGVPPEEVAEQIRRIVRRQGIRQDQKDDTGCP